MMHRHAAIVIAVLLGGTAAALPAQQNHRRTFISPMGQPYHGTEAAPDPERTWFNAVDTNGDGIITNAEFQADAARFFAILDRKHDGEIDPDDIDYYESSIAPEVRSGNGGPNIIANSSEPGDGAPRTPAYDASKLGAARFSYFDLPEPVTAADRNFNRGIDASEFAYAADKRFASLDKKKDGKLTWDELPHVTGRAVASESRRGGGSGRGGHHGGGRGRGGDFGGGQSGFGGGSGGGQGGFGGE